MVWVYPRLRQRGYKLQGLLHVPGHQHSPKTQIQHLYVSENKSKRTEKYPERELKETHLCFCLGVNPDDIFSAGGSYKGTGLFVLRH